MELFPENSTEENQIYFDTSEIDNQIFKQGICEIKIVKKDKIIKNKFKHLKDILKEELNSKDRNIEYPKYFSKIDINNFKYTGILTNNLKRDVYGYSLMENDDQFLGEYKKEIRDGFGIYKFKKNDEQDIYIGNYTNNKKTGEGIYLKIFNLVNDDSNKSLILVDYDCAIGYFDNDIFKVGKIFSIKDGEETLYKGKVNEIGEQNDDDALIFQDGDKIFNGKVVDGNMIEGRNIILNNNFEKEKGYYFSTNTIDKNNDPYTFDFFKNQENDDKIINIIKNYLSKDYKKQIQNIFNKINEYFEAFNDFDRAINSNFNEFKNEIKLIINNINKD